MFMKNLHPEQEEYRPSDLANGYRFDEAICIRCGEVNTEVPLIGRSRTFYVVLQQRVDFQANLLSYFIFT